MPPEDPYLALFRRIPVMATLLDQEGCFIDVSDAWVRRTGYTREALRGARPEDIATEDSARRIREELRPCFRRTGRLDNVPVEFRTADGSTLELLVTSTAEYDDGGPVPALAVRVHGALRPGPPGAPVSRISTSPPRPCSTRSTPRAG